MDSKDSDQTGWMDAQADLSLRWVHTHFVGFVMSRLNFCLDLKSVFRMNKEHFKLKYKSLIFWMCVFCGGERGGGAGCKIPIFDKKIT